MGQKVSYGPFWHTATVLTTQLSVKATQESPMSLMDLRTFETIMGLKTFNSKCPLDPPTVTATWLPITWAATIVMASHWVGFTWEKSANSFLYSRFALLKYETRFSKKHKWPLLVFSISDLWGHLWQRLPIQIFLLFHKVNSVFFSMVAFWIIYHWSKTNTVQARFSGHRFSGKSRFKGHFQKIG